MSELTPVPTTMSTSTSSASSTTSATSKASSYWSRELVFSASPHPSQLQRGRQIETAPMCPCHDCWEYGSHALAPPRPPKVPKAPKAPKPSKDKASTASSTAVVSEKKSPLNFLKRFNSSRDSVASDLRPLRQPSNLASAGSSVYSSDS